MNDVTKEQAAREVLKALVLSPLELRVLGLLRPYAPDCGGVYATDIADALGLDIYDSQWKAKYLEIKFALLNLHQSGYAKQHKSPEWGYRWVLCD